MLNSFTTFRESTSLEYHNTLNPALFDTSTNILQPLVREALLKYAHTWADYAGIPESLIQDIYLTGGNANYNYTSQSDIDVHIVLDRRGLGIPSQYLDDYLSDKKALWQSKHHATIRGYPLEPYAQDAGERFPIGQGVYSIYRNDWVIKPVHGSQNYDSPVLGNKIQYYKRQIETAINHSGSYDSVKSLKDKLNSMRSAGLEKAGEFSIENLTFKELRNLGLIDRLKDYENSLADRSLSLA